MQSEAPPTGVTPQDAKQYQAIKNRLFLFQLLLNFIFLLTFVATGRSRQVKILLLNIRDDFLSINALYFCAFSALAFLLSLPLSYYEGYWLEHRYGLSRQSKEAWLADLLKHAAVTFIVSLVLVEGVYFFLSEFSQTWWLWAAGLWFFVSVVMARLFPKLILPLFFKPRPLEDGALRQRIFALLDRYPLKLKDVYVLDFSKKTAKANAMVAGLGKTKQIYLSDTLIAEFPPEEIEMVLAHEVGHYVARDTFKLVAAGLVSALFSFFLAKLVLEKLVLFFGFRAVSDIASLPLFLTVLMLIGLVLLPLQNGFSRFLERRADLFALNATRQPQAFIALMERLGKKNFSDFAPSRLVEIFLYDHPPIAKRIQLARAFMTEKRRYRRLDHICPVEFQCLNPRRSFISSWYQAFTQDVSDGGICLTVNHIRAKDLAFFQEAESQLILHIHIPAAAQALRATGRLAWFKEVRGAPEAAPEVAPEAAPEARYVLGIAYEDIDQKSRLRISRYAVQRQYFRVVAALFTILLAAGLVAEGARNIQLRYENLALLDNLFGNKRAQEELWSHRRLLESQTEKMTFLLSQAHRKVEYLQQQLAGATEGGQKAVADLTNSIAFLKKYQEGLRRNLSDLTQKSTVLEAAVAHKVKERSLLEGKMLDKLYHWLLAHQNKATGLVASYEGDSDIKDWAFTYDQALAVITFVANGDTNNARKILAFYAQAPKSDAGAFANAYDTATGEIVEYTTHAGPNIWLGLAALQYTHQTKDTRYLNLARNVAVWLATVKDSEGGLRGGKEFSWYSTEHNLDAFAFYRMFYQISGEQSYQAQAEATLQWLKQNAYSALSQPVVKRGKGDATIATDTYAWSLTAVGPRRLAAIGMDPDGIIDFALEHCAVSVTYQKPDGATLNVRGFDFAKAQHLARRGVISCEWSAQMIMALKIMAEYHRQQGGQAKADAYGRLADDYASELSKMIITSDSAVGHGDFCLPYASAEMADTGHGWRTPKGNRTGSVAATAYAILAIKGHNPLVISE